MSLIGATTSTAGLKVYAQLDETTYPAKLRVSDAELDAVNLTRDEFHGEWNYTIKPRACRPTLPKLGGRPSRETSRE